MIVSCSAKSGVTSGFCTVSITATTAASAPDSSTATPITRFARTPSRRAVSKSIDDARMCRPISVRSSSSMQSSRQTAATIDRHDRDLANVDGVDRPRPVQERERRRDLAERPEPEQRDALHQERDRERGDEHHRGRLAAQRAEDEPVHAPARARARRRSRGGSRPRPASPTARPSRARMRRPSRAGRRRS